mgnify:CR=1 FL=1
MKHKQYYQIFIALLCLFKISKTYCTDCGIVHFAVNPADKLSIWVSATAYNSCGRTFKVRNNYVIVVSDKMFIQFFRRKKFHHICIATRHSLETADIFYIRVKILSINAYIKQSLNCYIKFCFIHIIGEINQNFFSPTVCKIRYKK